MSYHEHIRRVLKGTEKPYIIEIGAHHGEDTIQLASIPNSKVVAFEPDPSNLHHLMNRVTGYSNIFTINMAVSDVTGSTRFYPSKTNNGQHWGASGSILEPTGHLTEHPTVKFGKPINVASTRLDDQATSQRIDLIWMDVQGAELKVISGAKLTLLRTRYLLTEYSNRELYRGQGKLADIIDALGYGWRIHTQWDYDVLIENTAWQKI